jgi:hypothetical protein
MRRADREEAGEKGTTMNRRGFLGGLATGVAGIAGAVAVKVVPASGDTFMHNGFRVRWKDWITPPNQDVPIGMWFAKHTSKDLQWVSTTLGQCYPSRDWEVVDCTLARDWPQLTGFSSEQEKAAVKQRALEVLIAKL